MIGRDLLAHPDFGRRGNFSAAPFPGCVGELRYKDRSALDRDLAHLKAAAAKSKPAEVFMTAPSPGILTRFIINLHYPTEEAYVAALADVLKVEYRAIVEAGFVLQIDAPDLGSARNNQYRHLSDDEFRSKIAERNIAALNAAIEGLPADRMRLHICWGNYEGPHTHDLPVTKIIDIAFKARVQAFSIEAANPRHDHEWEDLKAIKIPDDKILIPGVINSTTNFVEHPRLVAQRIGRYAQVVDRERLIAGVDCGFGTAVRTEPMVADSIVWAKLESAQRRRRDRQQKAVGDKPRQVKMWDTNTPMATPAIAAATPIDTVSNTVRTMARPPILARPTPSATSSSVVTIAETTRPWDTGRKPNGRIGMAAARKSASSIHSDRTSGLCREPASPGMASAMAKPRSDCGLRIEEALDARRLIVRQADGLQPLRHPFEHRARVFLQVGRDARRHHFGLIFIGLGIEIGPGHHRHRGSDRARSTGDQHCLLIGGGRGDAEHQAEDRHGAVLHAEHDFAGGGL